MHLLNIPDETHFLIVNKKNVKLTSTMKKRGCPVRRLTAA